MPTEQPAAGIDRAVLKTAGVLIVGALAAVFDTTIVSIALHTLVADLHSTIATIQWVTTGYLLALAVTVPLSAWALRRVGGKRLWLVALVVFGLGSIGSSLAWSAPALIAFRVVQGVGGGLMLPLLQTLVMRAAGGKKLGRTVAIISLPALLGPILGPVAGGVILHWLSWRWMFWVNVPFCVAGIVLAWIFLADDAPGQPRSRLDAVGLALLSPGVAAVIYGLSRLPGHAELLRVPVVAPIVIGLALIAAFVVYALHRADALVDIRLLSRRPVGSATMVLFLSGFALYGAMLLLPLYYQQVRGTDALAAGLMLVPQGIGTLLSRSLAGRLTDQIGARWVVVAGFVIVAAATIPFALAGPDADGWLLALALLVRGFGLGAVTIPVMAVAYQGLAASDIPHASILTRTAQQLGGSFGAAVLAVVLGRVLGGGSGVQIARAFDHAFWWATGFTLLAIAVALWLPRPAPTSDQSAGPVTVLAR